MRRSWIFLSFIGSAAFSVSTFGATDKEELVLTRQQLRHQVYLYNGWMEDVQRSSENREWSPVDLLPEDLLPTGRVVANLVGQQKEMRFSPEDLAVRRDRLNRWIHLFATTRKFVVGKPSPRATASMLPVPSVALHFRRPKIGSSLVRDFAVESEAYATLHGLVSPLYDELTALTTEFTRANPKLKLGERAARFQTSKEVVAWLSNLKAILATIDGACAKIGYPVSAAWKIRDEVETLRKQLEIVQRSSEAKTSGKAGDSDVKKDPPRPASPKVASENPLERISDALEEIVNETRAAGYLCQTFSRAYADPPAGIDAAMLDLAWTATVPISDPDPELITTGLKQAANWIVAVGMSGRPELVSLEIVNPIQLLLRVRVEDSLFDFTPEIDRPKNYIGPENRLFYKFTSAIGATPSAVSMTLNAFSDTKHYVWHKGLLQEDRSGFRYVSSTTMIVLGAGDVARVLRKMELATSSTDVVVAALSESLRPLLVRYLMTFHGKVVVVHDDPDYLLLRVSNAKKMILGTEDVWEDADINFMISFGTKGATLLCIVDGRWAPGIFAPKSGADFRDMEPEYSKSLGDFAGQLLVRMKDDMLKQNNDVKPK